MAEPLLNEECAVAGADEAERLAALERYGILDTEREAAFDDIVELASVIFEAPIAVVNLVADGRQWFKAEIGIGARELPLDVSICRHAILQRGVFVVPDLTADPRFEDNPLVTAAGGLRFYAGALLETPEGLPLGTVCVLDVEPRPGGVTERQARALAALASSDHGAARGQAIAGADARERGAAAVPGPAGGGHAEADRCGRGDGDHGAVDGRASETVGLRLCRHGRGRGRLHHSRRLGGAGGDEHRRPLRLADFGRSRSRS
jgi:hypothetical protein